MVKSMFKGNWFAKLFDFSTSQMCPLNFFLQFNFSKAILYKTVQNYKILLKTIII